MDTQPFSPPESSSPSPIPTASPSKKTWILITCLLLVVVIAAGIASWMIKKQQARIAQKKYETTIQNLKNENLLNTSVIKGNDSGNVQVTLPPIQPTMAPVGYQISVVPDNATPSAYYLIKKKDTKTNREEIIGRISDNSAFGDAQNVFGKTDIAPFVISTDQRFIAYETMNENPSGNQATITNAIHIFSTVAKQDKVIYTESTNYLSLANQPTSAEQCGSNQPATPKFDACFEMTKQVYEKKPILFSGDDKKLILIGYTQADTNQGVYSLQTDIYQNSLNIISRNMLSKQPLLSPSGNFLLTVLTYHGFSASFDQTDTQILITVYDINSGNITYTNQVNAQPGNQPTNQFEVGDPSFITDQLLLAPTEKQLLTVNLSNNKVTDITSQALKGLPANQIIVFAVYYQPIKKIVFQVNSTRSYDSQAPTFSVNLDGSERKSFDIHTINLANLL